MAGRRFESVEHPGSSPWPAVYGMAIMTPIATCLLPVMILTLVGVLEGIRVLPFVFWGAGAAIVLAAAWTSFQLRRRIAEIRLNDEWVLFRSVRDVARGEGGPALRVLDVRDYGSWADVTLGLSTFELERRRWPEYDGLMSALQTARMGGG